MATAQTDPGDMIQTVGRSWGWILFFGIISILAGIVITAHPSSSVFAFAILWGAWLFVAGIFRLVEAIADSGETGGMRVLMAILGILSILIGLFFMRHVYQTVAIIAFLLGLFWVVGGIIEFVVAVSHRDMPGRGWRIFMGILGFIAGLIVLAEPGISLVTLAWVLGIWLVVYGIMEIVVSLQVRKLEHA
ncbi:MAG TPA: HdeD family acid-resistance protein [Actinomycetota bacterium]|jgi:uncharacterized membrane protein HdeD (DUF308 family)